MGEEPEAAQGPSLDRFLGQLSGKVAPSFHASPKPSVLEKAVSNLSLLLCFIEDGPF